MHACIHYLQSTARGRRTCYIAWFKWNRYTYASHIPGTSQQPIWAVSLERSAIVMSTAYFHFVFSHVLREHVHVTYIVGQSSTNREKRGVNAVVLTALSESRACRWSFLVLPSLSNKTRKLNTTRCFFRIDVPGIGCKQTKSPWLKRHQGYEYWYIAHIIWYVRTTHCALGNTSSWTLSHLSHAIHYFFLFFSWARLHISWPCAQLNGYYTRDPGDSWQAFIPEACQNCGLVRVTW